MARVVRPATVTEPGRVRQVLRVRSLSVSVPHVRQPLALRSGSSRRPEERLGLRFPKVLAFLARLWWRLPPTSRVRRVVVRRAVQLGFEAANRGDFESAFALYHSEVELIADPQLVAVGLDPIYRGRAERIHFQQRWNAEWGQFQFEPEELLDFGDRLMVLGRVVGSGLTSGAGFDREWGVLFTVRAGQVVRETFLFDRGAALAAAGFTA